MRATKSLLIGKACLPLLVLPLALLGAGCTVDAGSQASPVVQRHKFSNSTQTVPAETVQVEGGLEVNPGDGFDVQAGVRWGASPSTEFVLTADPYRKLDDTDGSGVGDVRLGVRHRLWDETQDQPAVAVEFSGKIPVADADEGLGSGEPDLFLALAADRNYREAFFTAYTQLGFLGDPGSDGSDVALLAAVAAQRPLMQRVQAFGEVAGLYSPDADLSALYLTAGGLVALAPAFTLDAGLSVGIGDDAESLLLRVGVTRSIGRPRAFPSSQNASR